MPLLQLLEVLIVVGVLLWLVNRFIPMQASIKSILNGVVVIAVVLWLLNVFGLFHSLSPSLHRNMTGQKVQSQSRTTGENTKAVQRLKPVQTRCEITWCNKASPPIR